MMLIMPMPAARSAPVPVITIDTPADSYSLWYPAGEALVTVTEVTPDAVYWQWSSGGAYTEDAMPWDAVREKWYRTAWATMVSQDTITCRVRVVVGSQSYLSDTIQGTINYPGVSIDTPADSFLISAGGVEFTGTIYVPEGSGTVTEAWMDVYRGASLEGSYALAYSSTANGKDYYSGTAESPATDGAGSVVGRMTIEGTERTSDARPGSWIVV